MKRAWQILTSKQMTNSEHHVSQIKIKYIDHEKLYENKDAG